MRIGPLHRVPGGLPAIFLLAISAVCLAQANTNAIADAASINTNDTKSPELKTHVDASSTYRIGVGDVLQISVWEEPQLTEAAVVRPDGMISMPLVSAVTVAGLTPELAASALTARLEKFVHKPRVTVVVQEIRSRMVYITGEVQRPGAYPLLDSMSVVQLIARSGGPTDFAKKGQVYVLRADSGARVRVDYRKVLKGQAQEQNIALAPGDTVVVP